MLSKLHADGEGDVHVAVVYLAEAHGSDEWPVGPSVSCVEQSTCIEDRITRAALMKATHGWRFPVLVDSMQNEFHEAWGAWPMRYFGLSGGRVVMRAEPCPKTHYLDMAPLRAWPKAVAVH